MFVWVYGRAGSAVAAEIILSGGQPIAEAQKMDKPEDPDALLAEVMRQTEALYAEWPLAA
jgi:hypothetical protein